MGRKRSRKMLNGADKQLLRVMRNSVGAVMLGAISVISAYGTPSKDAARQGYNIEIVSIVKSKDVFITIDDGWFPDRKVLNLIEKEKIPTTTFLIGDALQEHKKFWREYSKYGSIQNHTLSHPFLTEIKNSEARYEITADQKLISSITERVPYMMRPPYGAYNKNVTYDASLSGIKYVVLWSAEVPIGKDGYVREPFRIETFDAKELKPGEIILMHWDPGLYGAFNGLLRVVKEDGLKIGSLKKYLKK